MPEGKFPGLVAARLQFAAFAALAWLTHAAVPAGAVEFDRPWRFSKNALVVDGYVFTKFDWGELLKNRQLVGFINKASDGLISTASCNRGNKTQRELCWVKYRRYEAVKELYHTRRHLAKSLGLKWGAYHLGRPGNPIGQALHFLQYTRPEPDELLALDIEHNDPKKWMSLKDAEIFARIIKRKVGRYPVLYTNDNTAKFIAANRKDYPILSKMNLWYARYNSSTEGVFPLGHWESYAMWQFSSQVNCNGRRCPMRLKGTDNTVDINVLHMSKQQARELWPFDKPFRIRELPDEEKRDVPVIARADTASSEEVFSSYATIPYKAAERITSRVFRKGRTDAARDEGPPARLANGKIVPLPTPNPFWTAPERLAPRRLNSAASPQRVAALFPPKVEAERVAEISPVNNSTAVKPIDPIKPASLRGSVEPTEAVRETAKAVRPVETAEDTGAGDGSAKAGRSANVSPPATKPIEQAEVAALASQAAKRPARVRQKPQEASKKPPVEEDEVVLARPAQTAEKAKAADGGEAVQPVATTSVEIQRDQPEVPLSPAKPVTLAKKPSEAEEDDEYPDHASVLREIPVPEAKPAVYRILFKPREKRRDRRRKRRSPEILFVPTPQPNPLTVSLEVTSGVVKSTAGQGEEVVRPVPIALAVKEARAGVRQRRAEPVEKPSQEAAVRKDKPARVPKLASASDGGLPPRDPLYEIDSKGMLVRSARSR